MSKLGIDVKVGQRPGLTSASENLITARLIKIDIKTANIFSFLFLNKNLHNKKTVCLK